MSCSGAVKVAPDRRPQPSHAALADGHQPGQGVDHEAKQAHYAGP
jgi:hypothetical protein